MVFIASAYGALQVASNGRIHAAAPPQADKTVKLHPAGKLSSSSDIALLRVLTGGIVNGTADALLRKHVRGPRYVARGRNPLVRYNQGMAPAALTNTRRQFRQDTWPTHQPGTGSGRERLHPEISLGSQGLPGSPGAGRGIRTGSPHGAAPTAPGPSELCCVEGHVSNLLDRGRDRDRAPEVVVAVERSKANCLELGPGFKLQARQGIAILVGIIGYID